MRQSQFYLSPSSPICVQNSTKYDGCLPTASYHWVLQCGIITCLSVPLQVFVGVYGWTDIKTRSSERISRQEVHIFTLHLLSVCSPFTPFSFSNPSFSPFIALLPLSSLFPSCPLSQLFPLKHFFPPLLPCLHQSLSISLSCSSLLSVLLRKQSEWHSSVMTDTPLWREGLATVVCILQQCHTKTVQE